jgi:hypothetical protein
MQEAPSRQLVPGAVVEVTQQIPHRDRAWSEVVRGTVISFEQKQTGSWFAHSKADKLWLDRLVLRKEDGEVTTLNLDEFSSVNVLAAPVAAGEGQPAAAAGEAASK